MNQAQRYFNTWGRLTKHRPAIQGYRCNGRIRIKSYRSPKGKGTGQIRY
jgi:hypothetical protein